jgi:hypothetical protein
MVRKAIALQTDGAPQAPAAGNVSGKPRGLVLGGLSENIREPINMVKPKAIERPRSPIAEVNFDHRERFVTLLFELIDHRLIGSDRVKFNVLLR